MSLKRSRPGNRLCAYYRFIPYHARANGAPTESPWRDVWVPPSACQVELFVSFKVTPLLIGHGLRGQAGGATFALGNDWVFTLGFWAQDRVAHDPTPETTTPLFLVRLFTSNQNQI